MKEADRRTIPFRWDLGRREQLGQLLTGEAATFPQEYLPELRETAAKIVARSDHAELVFVGRSPENLFDYLSGAFSDLNTTQRLAFLQVSYRNTNTEDLTAQEIEPLLSYFRSMYLSPEDLTGGGRNVRFVDVVASGSTFFWLTEIFREWSEREAVDWKLLAARIGFIGLTCRGKNSPHTYRWQQSKNWLNIGPRISAKNVSLSFEFWNHIANAAIKVTPPFARNDWGSEAMSKPPRNDDHIKALRGAAQLRELGRQTSERKLLARTLAQQPEMTEPWLRRLALDLKRK